MMKQNTYNPNIAIHPGNTLQDTLKASGMNQVDLAQRTGMTTKHINEIIKGKTSLTADTAIKLSNVFGMSETFWNNLQKNYEEAQARLKAETNLNNEVVLFRSFTCYKELVKWGYVKAAANIKDRISNLRKFFGVSSLSLIQQTQAIAFRKLDQNKLSRECLAAWLRCGEIEAQGMETQKFNRNDLIGSINKLRVLTKESPQKFQKEMINICASCGIAVVFVPYFSKTYVNGATRWLNSDKAMIQLSLRGRSDDIFWFTFFHEFAHILAHGKKDQFVEFENRNKRNMLEKEKEADEIAGNILIPKSQYKQFKETGDFSDIAIKAFAKSIGISPSIVAGRLAHDTRCWEKFAHLHVRLAFKDPA